LQPAACEFVLQNPIGAVLQVVIIGVGAAFRGGEEGFNVCRPSVPGAPDLDRRELARLDKPPCLPRIERGDNEGRPLWRAGLRNREKKAGHGFHDDSRRLAHRGAISRGGACSSARAARAFPRFFVAAFTSR
jgi:hypothetical protein